jgi:hypothetical protein
MAQPYDLTLALVWTIIKNARYAQQCLGQVQKSKNIATATNAPTQITTRVAVFDGKTSFTAASTLFKGLTEDAPTSGAR